MLEKAALFITHAGMGSVMEALSCGVPLLLHPQAADQFLVTSRAVKLGVGKRLKVRDLAPQRLRDLAAAVMNDATLKQRVGEQRAAIAASPGVEHAAQLILEARLGVAQGPTAMRV